MSLPYGYGRMYPPVPPEVPIPIREDPIYEEPYIQYPGMMGVPAPDNLGCASGSCGATAPARPSTGTFQLLRFNGLGAAPPSDGTSN